MQRYNPISKEEREFREAYDRRLYLMDKTKKGSYNLEVELQIEREDRRIKELTKIIVSRLLH